VYLSLYQAFEQKSIIFGPWLY